MRSKCACARRPAQFRWRSTRDVSRRRRIFRLLLFPPPRPPLSPTVRLPKKQPRLLLRTPELRCPRVLFSPSPGEKTTSLQIDVQGESVTFLLVRAHRFTGLRSFARFECACEGRSSLRRSDRGGCCRLTHASDAKWRRMNGRSSFLKRVPSLPFPSLPGNLRPLFGRVELRMVL